MYPLDDLLSAPASERLTLIELAREAGKSPPTTWRWAMKGVRGLRLPTFMNGNTRTTTRSAYRWWCVQLTNMADGHRAKSSINRKREIERAESELDALGI